MHESCTVCGRKFEVQFRYQMEERDNAFSFFCSQACHGKSLRGETTSGVVCSCCNIISCASSKPSDAGPPEPSAKPWSSR